MMQYFVRWEIDIEADSPREAAEIARVIQLDAGSTAVVFDVQKPGEDDFEMIDLEED